MVPKTGQVLITMDKGSPEGDFTVINGQEVKRMRETGYYWIKIWPFSNWEVAEYLGFDHWRSKSGLTYKTESIATIVGRIKNPDEMALGNDKNPT